MELDDMKKTWQQDKQKTPNTDNIMEMIHQKSRGPIASLKNSFKRQMIAVSVLLMTVSITNAPIIETTPGVVLYSTYVAFCFAVILAFFLNYRLTSRMENMDKAVRANLENYITLLERRLQWQYFGSRLVVLLFILLLEILPLFYHARMLDKWHAVSPLIRFSAYAVYMLFVFFVSHRVKHRKFGRHLSHLKEMLQSTHEVN